MTTKDTESTCEVVRITDVLKHPNADRLEIAKFAFADGTIPDYQVVAGRGDFVVGQLAVYISDDMMVPVDRPEFAFLKDKAKGGYHRVRACRLRGEMSTGLLVKGDNLRLGSDMSTAIGVVKYISPLDRDNDSQGGQNIGTGKSGGGVLRRLVNWFSKKLYKPVHIPEYSVLSLRKVPGLFTEGEPVIITEKIHGSNIRFGLVNGRVYIGSHHREKSDSRPAILRWLSKRNKRPGYYGSDVWSKWFNREFCTKDRLSELPNNIVFYGELFGPGIQPWTYGLRDTQVMVYDAYDTKSKRWLSHSEILGALPLFIHTVPMHGATLGGIGFDKEIVKNYAEDLTSVRASFPNNLVDSLPVNYYREGAVVRSVDWKKAGKLVSDRYLASEH